MLFQIILFGTLSIALVFATSEIGQRVETTFDEINDSFCQLNWYLYPIEVQRMLIPILIYTEKPVVINFFGSITCSREQFKKVL